jgi:hypothetical protein
MHLNRARAESSLDVRVEALHTALSFAPVGDRIRLIIIRMLGRALKKKAQGLGVDTQEGGQALMEAAAIYEKGECWEKAGQCYLKLRDRHNAVNAFSNAGMIDVVEQILGEQQQIELRERQEKEFFKDYEIFYHSGQREESLTALRECISAAKNKGDYRRLLKELEKRILDLGRVVLQLENLKIFIIGRFPLRLGREGDCEFQVRCSSVSRIHAEILFDVEQGFSIRDCTSRNGTFLNQLRLGSPLPLPPAGTLGLGDSCLILFSSVEGPTPVLRLEIAQGPDQGHVAFAGPCPMELAQLLKRDLSLSIAFNGGKPLAKSSTGGEIRLNGYLTGGSIQLIKDDLLELGSYQIKVIG